MQHGERENEVVGMLSDVYFSEEHWIVYVKRVWKGVLSDNFNTIFG
jgi:uncharacterized protein YrrD